MKNENLTKRISINFDERDLEIIKFFCDARGVSPATFFRDLASSVAYRFRSRGYSTQKLAEMSRTDILAEYGEILYTVSGYVRLKSVRNGDAEEE